MINNENDLISFDINDLIVDSFDINDIRSDLRYNLHEEHYFFLTASYEKKENLSNEILLLINNDKKFKIFLLNKVQNKMKDIINNSSILQFKELITVLNLLSFGKDYKIFEKYNEYSSVGISSILRAYEIMLKESFEQGQSEFNIMFNYYMTLLDSFNELCIINSRDIIRKKSIKQITELLTESINLIKFSIKLEDINLKYLSTFQGKLLLLFSDTEHFAQKNLDSLLKEYTFVFNKQIDGYFLIAGDNDFESSYFSTFSSVTTSLLLSLVKILEKNHDDYFFKLNEIFELYNKYCLKEKILITTLDNFKKSLQKNLFETLNTSNEKNIEILIESFIQKTNLEFEEIRVIHSIVLYYDEITNEKLELICNKLLTIQKVNNDYLENFKLDIFDIIINKFIEKKDFKNKKTLFNNIKQYLYLSNTASHLITSFSKIHLSISYFYSFLDEKHLSFSQQEYFISENICAYTHIKDEYFEIYEEILHNNALKYLNKNSLPNKFTKKELIGFSHNLMKDFFLNEKILNKVKINNEISLIIEHILKDNEYSKNKFEAEVCAMISKNPFFGLCTCYIKKKKEYKNNFDELGYDVIKQDLINDYILIYKYSYSYFDSFKVIYEANKDFLKNTIINLLLSYLMKKSSSSYKYFMEEDETDLLSTFNELRN